MDDHAKEIWEAPDELHVHPQSLSAHCVKRFDQAHKRYVLSFLLLSAFPLKMFEDKHHVCSAPFGSEATLGGCGRGSLAMVGTNCSESHEQ